MIPIAPSIANVGLKQKAPQVKVMDRLLREHPTALLPPLPPFRNVLVKRQSTGEKPTALPQIVTSLASNPHLILNLILALINWVEGVFDFTYVESTSERSENRL
jgi:hypothetical protein